jgi:hypothetical protein
MRGKTALAEICPRDRVGLPICEVQRLVRRLHRQRPVHQTDRVQVRAADMSVARRASPKLLRIHGHRTVAYTGIPIGIQKVRVVDKA